MPAQKITDNKLNLKTLNKMEPNLPCIPSNVSQQHLMNECDGVEPVGSVDGEPLKLQVRSVTVLQWITVIILFFVNLINYMDRYTIAGVMKDIKEEFELTDDLQGLLQTVFVISYMVFAPLFGFLGDRYSRRWIMASGVFLWGVTTLAGSFMNDYWSFLSCRMLVGIGEASYSTVAPTIISDLFTDQMRSVMLSVFYFAIPVGSGLGYIIGSETAKLFGHWKWSLRVTPVLGALAVILIIFVMIEPERGASEGRTNLKAGSWGRDILSLLKNRSFVFSTLGFTCVAFVAGALSWWGPIYIQMGLQNAGDDSAIDDVGFTFGVITMISGVIGVPLGTYLSYALKPRMPRADPIICATGLILSAPLIFSSLILVDKHIVIAYILVFFGEVSLNLNWPIVADILLYVTAPIIRSTAEAFQILISHAFGDAGSPYLVGVVSEGLKPVLMRDRRYINGTEPIDVQFHSLQYSLFITCFVEVLGGAFFLLNALWVLEDKAAAERDTTGFDNPAAPTHIYADESLSRSEVNLTSA